MLSWIHDYYINQLISLHNYQFTVSIRSFDIITHYDTFIISSHSSCMYSQLLYTYIQHIPYLSCTHSRSSHTLRSPAYIASHTHTHTTVLSLLALVSRYIVDLSYCYHLYVLLELKVFTENGYYERPDFFPHQIHYITAIYLVFDYVS